MKIPSKNERFSIVISLIEKKKQKEALAFLTIYEKYLSGDELKLYHFLKGEKNERQS